MRIITFVKIFSFFLITLAVSEKVSFGQLQIEIDSLQNLLEEKFLDTKKKTAILNDLSVLYRSYDLEKAKKNANEALYLSRDNGFAEQQANAYINLANIFSIEGNTQKSFFYFDSAYFLFNHDDNYEGVASVLNDKGMVHETMGNYDSALLYYEKALRLNTKNNNKKEIANNYNNIGMLHYNWANYKEAIDYFKKAMEIDSSFNAWFQVAIDISNIGLCYMQTDKTEDAINNFKKAVQLANKANRENSTAPFYNNIGLAYYRLGNYNEAIKYFKYCLELNTKNGAIKDKVVNLSNIGSVYSKLGNYEKAEEYLNQGLQISTEKGLKKNKASLIKGLYTLFKRKNNFEKALEYYVQYDLIRDSIYSEESEKRLMEYEARFQSEKKEQEIAILNKENELKYEELKKQRIIIYFSLACLLAAVFFSFVLIRQIKLKKEKNQVLIQKNEEINQQKEEMLVQAEQIEETNIYLEKVSLAASKTDNAVMIMSKKGDIIWTNEAFDRMYGYTLEEYKKRRGTTLQQTSFNPKIAQELERCISKKKSIEYITNYTTKDGAKRWAQTSLTPILNSFGEVEKLISIDADITELKKQQEDLEFLNKELSQKNEEITQQRNSLEELNARLKEKTEEVLAQKEEILFQHKIIQQKNNSVASSIGYAKKIQRATMPPMEFINSLFPKNFILSKAKDIIGGDFCWIQDEIIEGKRYKFFSVIDCTGHGVPGAFMSLLSSTLLNGAVKLQKNWDPATILKFVSYRFYKSLHKTGEDIKVKTGMDIAFCTYDEKEETLYYAGASNPIYIINNNNFTEIKGDKIPIGVKLDYLENDFISHKIEIKPNDTVYLFSDGYADQFGGPNNKKFMLHRFKKLLCEINTLSMEEQYKILNYNFIKWKGSNEQTDDVFVLGIKF